MKGAFLIGVICVVSKKIRGLLTYVLLWRRRSLDHIGDVCMNGGDDQWRSYLMLRVSKLTPFRQEITLFKLVQNFRFISLCVLDPLIYTCNLLFYILTSLSTILGSTADDDHLFRRTSHTLVQHCFGL